MNPKLLLLLVILTFPLSARTNVSSWSLDARPSLSLTDKISVFQTNGGLSPLGGEGSIYIEEMPVPKFYSPRSVFASFTKKSYTSHIQIQVMDAFTDQELFRTVMEEPGIIPWQGSLSSDRVYFIITLRGEDIQLRSAGLISSEASLISPQNFFLQPTTVLQQDGILSITTILESEAILTLTIFDPRGNIVSRPLEQSPLGAGEHVHHWVPSTLSQSGEEYQVWLRAEHPRLPPVEMTRAFTLIP